MAALLGIGLVALEIVDRGPDLLARLLAGADGVDRVSHGTEGLERDHDLVVFGEIADQHEDLLAHCDASGCGMFGM
jgi:hypothetical protein